MAGGPVKREKGFEGSRGVLGPIFHTSPQVRRANLGATFFWNDDCRIQASAGGAGGGSRSDLQGKRPGPAQYESCGYRQRAAGPWCRFPGAQSAGLKGEPGKTGCGCLIPIK